MCFFLLLLGIFFLAWGNYEIGNKLFAAECNMEGYTIAGQPTGIADGLDDEWLHAPWDPND